MSDHGGPAADLPITLWPKVPTGERDAGAGLQVALERDRTRFVRELHDDVQAPRPAICGVTAPAFIVIGQACGEIGGDSGVVARGIARVLENVDKSLGANHAAPDASRRPSFPSSRCALRQDIPRDSSARWLAIRSSPKAKDGLPTVARSRTTTGPPPRLRRYSGQPSPAFTSEGWRRRPDLNRGWRFCRFRKSGHGAPQDQGVGSRSS